MTKENAFLILAHKNVHLLRDLIETLSLYDGETVVHFDKKSKVHFNQTFKHQIEEGKVHFIKNNIKVHWAGSSIVHASCLLIDHALHNLPECSYYHLLSENCFPVKSPGYFSEFIRKNKRINFIKTFELPNPQWKNNGGMDRMDYYHFNDYFDIKKKDLRNITYKLFNAGLKRLQSAFHYKRSYPKNFPKLYGGGQWWSLTHETVKYLDNYYKRNNAVVKRFSKTLAPDEIFFQTLFMHSPFADLRSDNNLRYVDWRRELAGPFPRILNEEEHWNIIQQPQYLFARKVNPSNSAFTQKIKNEIICKNSAVLPNNIFEA